MHMAMPMPPPMHSVARPFFALRFCSADRMANRDRTAVDVDLGGIPAEVLIDRAGLRREGFIGLDQVEIANLPAGLCRSLALTGRS
jgi:hypothetical protein